MSIRNIDKGDYQKGIIELLSQLTSIDKEHIPENEFQDWSDIINVNPFHHIIVIEKNGQIIGTATLFMEPKLIHNFSLVGHIEDVVVDKDFHKQGYGRSMIQHLTDMAYDKGCYKVILNCAKDNAPFYEKCGYEEHGLEMSKYFE